MANDKDISITTGAVGHDLSVLIAAGKVNLDLNDITGSYGLLLSDFVEVVLDVQKKLIDKHSTGAAPKGGNPNWKPGGAQQPKATGPRASGGATEKSVGFALKLIAEDPSGYEAIADVAAHLNTLSQKEVSAIIEAKKTF